MLRFEEFQVEADLFCLADWVAIYDTILTTDDFTRPTRNPSGKVEQGFLKNSRIGKNYFETSIKYRCHRENEFSAVTCFLDRKFVLKGLPKENFDLLQGLN